MNKTLKEQRIALANIQSWITDQVLTATDKEVRDYLFEARQAIGFSLLHLARVEYRTISIGEYSEDQVDYPPASGGDGGLTTND
jgi:hypothetical protein